MRVSYLAWSPGNSMKASLCQSGFIRWIYTLAASSQGLYLMTYRLPGRENRQTGPGEWHLSGGPRLTDEGDIRTLWPQAGNNQRIAIDSGSSRRKIYFSGHRMEGLSFG